MALINYQQICKGFMIINKRNTLSIPLLTFSLVLDLSHLSQVFKQKQIH